MACLIQDKRGIFYIVAKVGTKRIWKSTRTRNKREAYKIFLATDNKPLNEETNGLSHHIASYIQHVKATFGTKTYQVYDLALRNLLRFTGDVSLDIILPRTIDLYKIERLKTVSPATVNIELRAFKAFFNCLRRWEYVAKNPCEGITSVRSPQRIPAYLTMEQLEKLVKGIGDPWLRRIVTFAAMTGARLGEILHLTWNNVDMVNRVMLIQSSVSYQVKSGKVRAIPMNQSVFEMLNRTQERTGLVFPGKRGGTAQTNHVSRRFRQAVRAAGMDRRLHFHSLRHTFASLLVQKGVSLYHVQKLLGHSSPRVTEIYAHLQNPLLHSVVDIIQMNSICSTKSTS
ncbi:MAG: tyrosine-type recombinase/integrase [Bacteroidota bacterium]